MSVETPAPQAAEIVREYGPFAGTPSIAGVTHDGRHVWAATGHALLAIDPASGEPRQQIACPCDAGTAFDGRFLYQIAEARIDKIDPASGQVVASIPAPGQGGDSGLAWAEGSLWVGQHRSRKIHQIDPANGAPATERTEVRIAFDRGALYLGVTCFDSEPDHSTRWQLGRDASLSSADGFLWTIDTVLDGRTG